VAYIYRHIRLDKNEPFYIGIGANDNDLFKRANHIHRYHNKYWKNIYLKTPIEVEIILENLTLEEAKIKEVEFIKIYGRKDLGLGTLVNQTDGGDGVNNRKRTEQEKISISNGHKGKKLKESTKQKLREINIGKKQSKETIEKRMIKIRGRKLSEEHKKKLSLIKNHRNFQEKKVIDLNTGIQYDSAKLAAIHLNMNYSYLCARLRGSNKNNTTLIYA
jgi:hypothetical protein